MIALTPAAAQIAGGIGVAPVMVTMSGDHTIASLQLSNGRDRPTSFEVDAYSWTQVNGQDVLTPTQDLIVAPGVFEIAAGGKQIVRLGVIAPAAGVERTYRIVMRELPSRLPSGNVLGFTLEMSLPVFVAPIGVRPQLEARAIQHGQGRALLIANTGSAHTQILSVVDADGGPLSTPHYLLSGASAIVPLPRLTRTVHVTATEANGAPLDHLVNVEPAGSISPG